MGTLDAKKKRNNLPPFFREFMLALHVTSKGTPEEKLSWAFRCFFRFLLLWTTKEITPTMYDICVPL